MEEKRSHLVMRDEFSIFSKWRFFLCLNKTISSTTMYICNFYSSVKKICRCCVRFFSLNVLSSFSSSFYLHFYCIHIYGMWYMCAWVHWVHCRVGIVCSVIGMILILILMINADGIVVRRILSDFSLGFRVKTQRTIHIHQLIHASSLSSVTQSFWHHFLNWNYSIDFDTMIKDQSI